MHSQAYDQFRFVRFGSSLLLGTLITVLLAGAVGLLWLRLSGDRLLGVQTASMKPTFLPGDALLVKSLPANQLRLGEIISYHRPDSPNVIISHRLVARDTRTGWLATAGDALQSRDSAFPPSLAIGRVVAIAPRLGSVLSALRRPVWLGPFVYLPGVGIMTGELWRLVRHFTYQPYRPHGLYRRN